MCELFSRSWDLTLSLTSFFSLFFSCTPFFVFKLKRGFDVLSKMANSECPVFFGNVGPRL